MELACIDPNRIDEYWPVAKPLIKSAIDKTGLSDFDRIEREVLDGLQLLWLACSRGLIEAAAVTQLIDNPKTCVVVACGGAGLSRWVHLISGIEAYAKAEGCSCMRIGGRPGWERVLEGYKAKYVILDKEI